MSSQDLAAVIDSPAALAPFTGAQVKARLNMLVDCMRSCMTDKIDYGTIPGCGTKPTLLKPGAEKIATMFRLASEVKAEDISATGDEVRYRVTVRLVDASGALAGSGIGECSSSEDKFCWKAVACQQEWDATPEDRRRLKWKKGQGGTAYSIQQIRTNPPDVANTVLKMGKKRALVDAVLTCTAASALFTQDIEDMDHGNGATPVPAPPQRKSVPPNGSPAPQAPAPPAPPAGKRLITDPQSKRLYAIWKGAQLDDAAVKGWLKSKHGLTSTKEITTDIYDEIVGWCQRGGVEEPPAGSLPPEDEAAGREPGSDG